MKNDYELMVVALENLLLSVFYYFFFYCVPIADDML